MVLIKYNLITTMLKNKIGTSLIVGVMAVTGLGVGVATMASAQGSTSAVIPPATAITTSLVDTPEVGDVADTPENTAESSSSPDTDNIQNQDGATNDVNGVQVQQGEYADIANDADGSVAGEANETASPSEVRGK